MGHLEAAVAFHRPVLDNRDNHPVQAQAQSVSGLRTSAAADKGQASSVTLLDALK